MANHHAFLNIEWNYDKMRRKSIFLILTVLLLVLSNCSNSPFFNPFGGGDNLNTVRIPENFSWNLSAKVDLEVVMELEGQGLESIEGEWIFLLDTAQNILTRAVIHNQQTRLYYKIPASTGAMIVYFPTTGNYETIYSWACLGTLFFNYAWEDPDEENDLDYLELLASVDINTSMKSSPALKASVFGNSDFSNNSLTSSNSYSSNNNVDGQWYVSTKNKAPASIVNEKLLLGQQKNKKVEIFQTVSWTEGGDFEVKVQVEGTNDNTFKLKLLLLFYTNDGSSLRQTTKTYNLSGANGLQQIAVSEEVPSNTSYIKFIIQDNGAGVKFYVDNITSTYNSDPDSDNDGLLDKEEDYPNDPLRAFNDYYPASGEFGTLAFEDLWPARGDYDFNDLIIDYQYNQIRNADNLIVEILGTFKLRAIGGSFHNGFGFELPFAKNLVSGVDGQELQEGIVKLESNGIETESEKATVIVFEDAWNYIRVQGVSFVNTHSDSEQANPYTFNIHIDFTKALTNEEAGSPPYNPFIFVNGDRSKEIHLFGHEPTDLMDESFFGTGDDFSDSNQEKFYRSAANLPWALDVPSSFDYPEEKNPINEAYLKFIEWAETSGTSSNDWYQEKDGYRNNEKIFKRK